MNKLIKCLIVVICFSGFNAMLAKSQNAEKSQPINWHSFEWHTQSNHYFSDKPHRIMLGNFHIGGIPEVQTFIISLNSPFSVLYDYGYDNMVYRNPAFATKVESVQRASTLHDRVIRDLELSINKQIFGEEDMRIITTEKESRNDKIKGELGFGIFHRNQKILLVDNPGSQFACIEEIPAEMEEKITFVPMKVEMGYLVVPLTIGTREVEMFFDGTSRPALVVFHNRTFRQLASSNAVSEKLYHITEDNEYMEIEGFEPEEEILFKGLPLSSYNVYNSGEKAPSGIRGKISQAFFENYIMIFDYKNGRFGLMKPREENN